MREVDERCALINSRILSCVSCPKCRGVAPLTGAAHTALLLGGKSSTTPPTEKVPSIALFDQPYPQRAQSGGLVGTGELIKRCSLQDHAYSSLLLE
ncbi:hypothetical protein PAMP_012127 [Pampus punctatissimus]